MKSIEEIESWAKSIEEDPCDILYVFLSREYGEIGKYTEAIKSCDIAIKLNSDSSLAYYHRGKFNLEIAKYTEAMTDCDKAIKLSPDFCPTYFTRGNIYSKIHKYTEAISDYNKVIELNAADVSNEYPTYCNRGIAYYNLGKYTKAIEDYNKAIEINPDFAFAYFVRGKVYARLLDENIKSEGLKIDNNSAYTDYNTCLYLLSIANKKQEQKIDISTLISFFQPYPQTILTISEYLNTNIETFLSLSGKLEEAQQSIVPFLRKASK